MKEKTAKGICASLIVLIVVALGVLVAVLVRRAEPATASTAPSLSDLKMSETPPEEETPAMNYHIDIQPYLDAIMTTDPAFLVLVNPANSYGDTVPSDLVWADETTVYSFGRYQMEKTALTALTALCLEAESDGVRGIDITSAYRSFDKQNALFETYCDREMREDPTLNRKQAEALVERYSCRPGRSEHQTGLAVDLWDKNDTSTRLEESFADTEAGLWLAENAARFGFVLRFPREKSDVTGIDFEPWHFRFVGYAAAMAMKEKGMCLEEYVNYIAKQNS